MAAENIASVIKNIKDGFKSDGSFFKEPRDAELSDRDWRADPTDGLRPLKKLGQNGLVKNYGCSNNFSI